MSLTSTYMQVQNYEGQLAMTRKEMDAFKGQATNLEKQLARAGKMNLSVHVILEGVDNQKKLPPLNDASCRYYDAGMEKWVEELKVNPGGRSRLCSYAGKRHTSNTNRTLGVYRQEDRSKVVHGWRCPSTVTHSYAEVS
jgi:hypothetical protein